MATKPASIPWCIAVPPEVYCEYCGVKLGDYHRDPQLMMDVQLEGPRLLHEKYGIPPGRGVSPDFSTYATGSTLGLQIDFLQEHAPSPKGHPIKSVDEAAALRAPEDIRQAGVIPQMLEYYEYMKAHAPDGVSVGFGLGGQAPLTTAVLLRGHDFFLDIYDAPEKVHRFMETLTENAIRERELGFEITGGKPGDSIGFTDDYGGLLPPDQYIEFDLRYMLEISDHFGATRRSSHTELLKRPHLTILQDNGWTYIDVGTDPYITVKDCVELLHIDWLVQLKTSDEMLLATPEQVQATYRKMVADGAKQMLVELCPGIAEENIFAFIEVAKEYE